MTKQKARDIVEMMWENWEVRIDLAKNIMATLP